jgi:hypothetical protein
MRPRMMHGMVHDVVMPVVVHNPMVYGMMYLRIGKTGQSDKQSDRH